MLVPQTMEELLKKEPNEENFCLLKLARPDLFYRLPSNIILHVLQRKNGKLERSESNATTCGVPLASSANETDVFESLDEWVFRIEEATLPFVERKENIVLITAGTLENAIYYFYSRTFEFHLNAKLFGHFKTIGEALNSYESGKKEGESVYDVHVFLASCMEFDKLLRAAESQTKKYPCHEAICGKAFIDEEVTDVLKICKKRHAGIVTD